MLGEQEQHMPIQQVVELQVPWSFGTRKASFFPFTPAFVKLQLMIQD